jgi:hypothetical protein
LHQIAPFLPFSPRNPGFCARSAAVLSILAVLVACEDQVTEAIPPVSVQARSDCVAGGRLKVETFGALQADIDWREPAMRCEGMQRPRGEGARLRFAGELTLDDATRTIAFILSIPELEKGKTADQLRTRVTVIEEENARFYSTRETDICWSNITHQAPLTNQDGIIITGRYSISGLTYCLAPVAELNGAASLTLSDMEFTGQLRWAREK